MRAGLGLGLGSCSRGHDLKEWAWV